MSNNHEIAVKLSVDIGNAIYKVTSKALSMETETALYEIALRHISAEDQPR